MKHPSPKRFIIAFFGVMLSAFIILWVWAAIGRTWYMPPEYMIWQYKEQMITQTCHEGQTVIIGDSLPMVGLIPDILGDDVMNLGLAGVTPIELYYITKKLRHCSKPPKAIVIAMAPSHFMAAEAYWGRALAYQVLSFTDAIEVQKIAITDREQTIYKTSLPNIIHDFFMATIITSNFPTFYYEKLVSGVLQPETEESRKWMDEMVRERGHRILKGGEVIDKPGLEGELGKFHPWKVLDIYMRKTAAELNDIGVPVYYMDMPETPLTISNLPDNYREDYDAYLREVMAPYPNLHRWGKILPSFDIKYYHDRFGHLNPEGARMFSELLKPVFPH